MKLVGRFQEFSQRCVMCMRRRRNTLGLSSVLILLIVKDVGVVFNSRATEWANACCALKLRMCFRYTEMIGR